MFSRIEFCGSNLENKTELNCFWKKKQVFSWNYASAHAECNFDNPAKKPTKIQKSAQPLKLGIQTTSLPKLYIFLGKLFRSHRLHVWQLCQKNRRKSEKLSAQKIEKYIITEVFFFWTRRIQNWHYYLEFVPKLTNFFFQNLSFPQKLLCRHR